MATVKSTQITNLDAGVAIGAHEHGLEHTVVGEYTAAALAALSTIRMVRVPKGARIVGGELQWAKLGTGTSFRVAVGDDDDSDRFMLLAQANNNNGFADIGSGRFNGVDAGGSYRYTCERDISVYVADGGTYTGALKLTVRYLPYAN